MNMGCVSCSRACAAVSQCQEASHDVVLVLPHSPRSSCLSPILHQVWGMRTGSKPAADPRRPWHMPTCEAIKTLVGDSS
jgi:hypothetical protein